MAKFKINAAGTKSDGSHWIKLVKQEGIVFTKVFIEVAEKFKEGDTIEISDELAKSIKWKL